MKAVIQYINARGGLAWRNQSGRTLIRSGDKTRAIQMGRKGLPDVVGVWPCPDFYPSKVGVLIAVECKRPGNTLTPAQELMLAELRKRGAIVVVAYSITDVEKALA